MAGKLIALPSGTRLDNGGGSVVVNPDGTITLTGVATITSPTLAGTIAGTYTLGGTPSLGGTLDAANNIITNIGVAGTDFTATGGLNLATRLEIGGVSSTDGVTTANVGLNIYNTTKWNISNGNTNGTFVTISTNTGGVSIAGILMRGRRTDASNSDVGQFSIYSSDGVTDYLIGSVSIQRAADVDSGLISLSTRPTGGALTQRATIGSTGITTLLNTLDLSAVAVSGGSTALLITQGAHTAVTVERPALSIVAATITLADTTTIAEYAWQRIAAPTFNGVAAGGAEVITDAATLIITGAPVQGTNITLTRTHALWVKAGIARFTGTVQLEANQVLAQSATEVGISVRNTAFTTGSEGSLIIPILSAAATDTLAGNIDGALATRTDATFALWVRGGAAWRSVAVAGFNFNNYRSGVAPVLGVEAEYDETICPVCQQQMYPGETFVFKGDRWFDNGGGRKGLHSYGAHLHLEQDHTFQGLVGRIETLEAENNFLKSQSRFSAPVAVGGPS